MQLDFVCYTLACRDKMSSQALALSSRHTNLIARQLSLPFFYACRPKRGMTTTRTEEEEEGAKGEAANRPRFIEVHYL